jgi:hypothetical protein
MPLALLVVFIVNQPVILHHIIKPKKAVHAKDLQQMVLAMVQV